MIYHRLGVEHNRRVWSCGMNVLLSAPTTLRVLRIDVECGLVRARRATATEYFAQLDWTKLNGVLARLDGLEAV